MEIAQCPQTYAEALNWASLLLTKQEVDPDGARYVLMTRADWTPSQLIFSIAKIRCRMLPGVNFRRMLRGVNFEPAQYITGQAPFLARCLL